MNSEEEADLHYWRAFDLSKEDRPDLALLHGLAALEHNPNHLQALVLVGEIYLLESEEIGMLPASGVKTALGYFEAALVQEPRSAEAWSCKGLALLYAEQPEEALLAAENGLRVLSLRVGYGMTSAAVYTNICEALYDCKVCALIELGRQEEARSVLHEGLELCPGSIYLTRLIPEVSTLLDDTC